MAKIKSLKQCNLGAWWLYLPWEFCFSKNLRKIQKCIEKRGMYRVRQRNSHPLIKFLKTGHSAKLMVDSEFSTLKIRRWYIQEWWISNLSCLVNIIALKQAVDYQEFEAKTFNVFQLFILRIRPLGTKLLLSMVGRLS